MNKFAELHDVSCIYHELSGETLAVSNINFFVAEGEFVSIVGPSGCGKSSVLSMLAGLTPPSSGYIKIGNWCSAGDHIHDQSDISAHKNSKNSMPLTGYMLQHDNLLEWRTVEGNIMLGLEVKGLCTKKRREYALSLLEKNGLLAFKDYYPRQLSGGMRQKVALIRTLAFSPGLLLLDEPFSALDYQTRLMLADDLAQIIRQEGRTAILVTHDISEAISMSDRVIVFSKRPATVKREFTIELGDDLPLIKRNHPLFKDYFNAVWKELDYNEQT
ncbi:MAG: ABC transporter ATP-binding protein [Clostridia bacterium]|nr:ABC transporter ATP-binding protein [Clostridia bacterium]